MDNDDDAPPPPEKTQAGERTSNEYSRRHQGSQHDSADFGSVAPNQAEPKSPPILPPADAPDWGDLLVNGLRRIPAECRPNAIQRLFDALAQARAAGLDERKQAAYLTATARHLGDDAGREITRVRRHYARGLVTREASATPESALIEQEEEDERNRRVTMLRERVSTLTERQREVLRRSFECDEADEVIATALGSSEEAVRQARRQGIKRLRILFGVAAAVRTPRRRRMKGVWGGDDSP